MIKLCSLSWAWWFRQLFLVFVYFVRRLVFNLVSPTTSWLVMFFFELQPRMIQESLMYVFHITEVKSIVLNKYFCPDTYFCSNTSTVQLYSVLVPYCTIPTKICIISTYVQKLCSFSIKKTQSNHLSKTTTTSEKVFCSS